jgi:hypothetical protein
MTKTDYDTASYERGNLIRNISKRVDEISLKGLPGTADQ